MKKRSILASKVLACAMASITMFACNNNKTATVPISGDCSADGIAYVYIDSLVNEYDLYNDLTTKLMAKQKEYEQDLQSKQNSIERRAKELQQNYDKHLITPTRAQEVQQQLAMEQQKLQQVYQQQALELQEDQAHIMNQVGDSIKNFINEFNSDNKYKFILSSQGVSTILYGDPTANITEIVLKELNKRYRNSAESTETK